MERFRAMQKSYNDKIKELHTKQNNELCDIYVKIINFVIARYCPVHKPIKYDLDGYSFMVSLYMTNEYIKGISIHDIELGAYYDLKNLSEERQEQIKKSVESRISEMLNIKPGFQQIIILSFM